MKIKTENLLISIMIPLALGQLASLLTKNSGMVYSMFQKPASSPPAILFPIVWTLLYILMGISSYLIYVSGDKASKSALTWYALQLFMNFTWSLIFFGLQNYLLAFIWLLILIVVIVIMIKKFYAISPLAALLQVPYLLWSLYAAYLNFAIYTMNR